MAYIEPLNLETLFINLFAGSYEIFIFLAFIMIGGLAGLFRMSNLTATMMMVIFVVIFANFIPGIYLVVVLLAGLISFRALSKLVKN